MGGEYSGSKAQDNSACKNERGQRDLDYGGVLFKEAVLLGGRRRLDFGDAELDLAVLTLDHFAADFLRDNQQLAAFEIGADQLDGHTSALSAETVNRLNGSD